MDAVTKNVSEYVRKMRINLAAMARDTGIPYMALYDSLMNENRERDIRGGELLDISAFLGVDPRQFAENRTET